MRKYFQILALFIFAITSANAAERLAEHVVVIGLDGCRPEAIQQAAGPQLKSL